MALKIDKIFENNTCNVCGYCDINQYFGINDNYIEYDKSFISFREILVESLGFQVSSQITKICFIYSTLNICTTD